MCATIQRRSLLIFEWMKKIILFSLVFCILISGCSQSKSENGKNEAEMKTIRYVAIGDSYTIGEGVKENQRWPNLLVDHLNKEGIKIELVANPSVTGWTTQQAIDLELPILRREKPDFVTVLLGVNDGAQGATPDVFRKRFSILLDEIQKNIPDKSKIVVVTVPDFSVTPRGKTYNVGFDISKAIDAFNSVIKDEAQKRNLSVADINPISKGMINTALVGPDGLHPAPQEYVLWEEVIYPVARELLK